jgi:hypothetical protein
MTESPTRVDEAIERGVRDLMRRDPPAGFRARVLARLDAPARRIALWPALATAGGVLAATAVGIVLLRDAPVETPREPGPVAAARPAPSPPAPDAAPARPESSASAVEPTGRRRPRTAPDRTATFGPRSGRVSAASLTPALTEGADAVVPPVPVAEAESSLSSPLRIEVRPLTSPTPIEIAPIVVPPIRIPLVPQGPASPPR